MIRDLTAETTYYFKMQARNDKGFGPMSATVIYITPKGRGVGVARVVAGVEQFFNCPVVIFWNDG